MASRSDIFHLWNSDATGFEPQGQFQMAYIAPPQDLAHFITTFYIFRSRDNVIRDVQPAGVGHLMFFLKGQGQARFHDGHIDDSHPVSLICPSNAAMQYIVLGPFHCFGCAFTPIGWRAFTNLRANVRMDQLVSADEIIKADCSDMLTQLRSIDDAAGECSAASMLVALGESLMWAVVPLLSQCFARVPQQLALRVEKITAWIEADFSPRVEDLVDQLGISNRQVQRLVTEIFGCSPKFLARKYRALRVAMALSDPHQGDADKSSLFDLFYDQSHMIRELRHFVGKTPNGLTHDANGILQMWLDPENIRELRTTRPGR